MFLQTRNAKLPLLRQIVANDYRGLYEELCQERSLFRYPPFTHIVNVMVKHTREQVAEGAAVELAGRLRQWFGDRVLGPDKPSVARVKRQYIRKIVLKLENKLSLTQVRQCLRQAQAATLQDKRYAAVVIYYDVDPL